MTSEQSNTPEAELDAALDALVQPAEGEEVAAADEAGAEEQPAADPYAEFKRELRTKPGKW